LGEREESSSALEIEGAMFAVGRWKSCWGMRRE
jgi:hypothetical protein